MGYSLPPLAFFEITPVHKHTESLIMPLSVQLETPHSGKYEQPTGLFINNEFVKGAEGKTFEVINPSTEEVITSVHEATEKDIDIAVAAARKAFEGPWRKETPENRGKLIVKLANLFEENLDLLAAVESLDNGKAINMAKVDISMCVGCLRYFGGWTDKIEGRVIDTNPDTFNYAKKEPIGVCAQIIPWNFPLLMWAWKIGPAIACGNTVVLKTAEQTPLGGLVAAKLIKEAGFPPGVVNIISGFGKIAGAALSSHMVIDKVAFTGSTVVSSSTTASAAAPARVSTCRRAFTTSSCRSSRSARPRTSLATRPLRTPSRARRFPSSSSTASWSTSRPARTPVPPSRPVASARATRATSSSPPSSPTSPRT